MAKSKNHTNHNQSHKNHRNGIKKPSKLHFKSLKGVDQKYVRNMKISQRKNRELARNNRKEDWKTTLLPLWRESKNKRQTV
ncbi:hypothetical protein ACOME3_007683 [Neoechinorhynchus agilis]